jgi:mRNA-degrading endonuclease YafQ of YafQ-DinJ toxin-antitoxin module
VNNPFDETLKTHKLKGKLKEFWSFSVNYSFRIVFEFIKKDEVIFYDIGDHRIYQ